MNRQYEDVVISLLTPIKTHLGIFRGQCRFSQGHPNQISSIFLNHHLNPVPVRIHKHPINNQPLSIPVTPHSLDYTSLFERRQMLLYSVLTFIEDGGQGCAGKSRIFSQTVKNHGLGGFLGGFRKTDQEPFANSSISNETYCTNSSTIIRATSFIP
jgi:hypothetical protein